MTVIDTLKLARALRDKGGFTQDAAEATAEALNSALGAEVATKGDITELKRDIAGLEQRLSARLTFLQWQIGLAIAGEVVIGLPALWLLLRIAAKVGTLG